VKTTLLLVEDHELVAEGMKSMLGTNYRVLAVIHDGARVMDAVALHQPAVMLLDLSLPNRTGIDLLPELRAAYPDLRVVVVTMHADANLIDMALKLGASGFVPKNAGSRELESAIEEVLAGRRYVSPLLSRRGPTAGIADRLGFDQLTSQQQRIVRLIGKGMTSEEIAEVLGVTSWTIHFHRKNIRRKLGVQNDYEMIRYAMLVNLADEDETPPLLTGTPAH